MIADSAYERLAGVVRTHVPRTMAAEKDRIGVYQLHERLGKGSAGEVFRALDPDGHPVALKLLGRRWRGPRYARELELLERTSHYPGVVSLLDAGQSPRGPFLVLELAEGGSLRRHLKARGKLPWAEAVSLVGRVAGNLEALHAEGIVHRDLKPENILLSADGRPLISDFGLAKDLSEADGELTQAGIALGTIGYMAPELWDGDRSRLGPWTDVFALGAVLHEIIAGELPFPARTIAEAAQAIREGSPRALHGVPANVAALVKKALARSVEDRFRSGGELARAADEVLRARG